MTKFKIQVETKQLWEVELDLKTKTDAEHIRDLFYEQIQETIANIETQYPNVDEPEKMFHCVETFGGDDLSDDDIKDLDAEELPEADRAGLSAVYTLVLQCPHCGAEIYVDDSEGRYGDIIDGINHNGFSIVTCDECEKQFRQTSYKEY